MVDDFDTADDIPAAQMEGLDDLKDLSNLLFSKIMSQDHAGIAHVGSSTVRMAAKSHWGKNILCGEDWFAFRSWPRGRIGEPLCEGETRLMAVRIRRHNSSMAKIANIVLWLIPKQTGWARLMNSQVSEFAAESDGPSFVNFVPVHVFSWHSLEEQRAGRLIGARNFNACLGQCATVTHKEGVRVEAGFSEALLAGCLLARPLQCLPVRDPVVDMSNGDYLKHRLLMQRAMSVAPSRSATGRLESGEPASPGAESGDQETKGAQVHIESNEPSATKTLSTDVLADYLFVSRSILRCATFSSTLDIMSSSFFEGARSDDLNHPKTTLLAMALCVRIACSPTRFGLGRGSNNDVYSAHAVSSIFESYHKPIIILQEDRMYAIDLVLQVAFDSATHSAAVEKAAFVSESAVKKKKSSGKKKAERQADRAEKAEKAEREAQEPRAEPCKAKVMLQSLIYLKRLGFALCNDVCGPPVVCADGDEEESLTHDPLQRHMASECTAAGLGKSVDAFFKHCISTKAQRQAMLVKSMNVVEIWLRTGMVGNMLMSDDHPADPSILGTHFARGLSESESRADGVRDAVEKNLNTPATLEAMLLASGMLNGGANLGFASMDSMSFALGKNLRNSCAQCDTVLNTFEGLVMSTFNDECTRCHRPICFKCRDQCSELFKELEETAKKTGKVAGSLSIKACIRCKHVAFSDADKQDECPFKALADFAPTPRAKRS